ncbi:hypothetical protein HDU84_006966 [Entophlyctis sp. JEL0112]|nr:hypothetical protein HDU84_006966 [Entophlyctis sp. JEL0112]
MHQILVSTMNELFFTKAVERHSSGAEIFFKQRQTAGPTAQSVAYSFFPQFEKASIGDAFLQCNDGQDTEQMALAYPGLKPECNVDGETYFGFIADEVDALILIEATITALLAPFPGTAVAMANLRVRSGSVFVMTEKNVTDSGMSADSASSEGTRSIAGVAPAYTKSSLKAGTQIMMEGEVLFAKRDVNFSQLA